MEDKEDGGRPNATAIGGTASGLEPVGGEAGAEGVLRFIPIDGVEPFEMTEQEQAEALEFMRQAKAWLAAKPIQTGSQIDQQKNRGDV